ncbi:MAG: cytochrome c3 family protein [Bacteroidota bacterium]
MALTKEKIVSFSFAAFIIITIGCTPKIRSYFFDGVPMNTDTIQIVKHDSVIHHDSIPSLAVTGISTEPPIYYHPPYRNKKCRTCHDPTSAVRLIQEQPELCYNCHDNFSSQYRFMHGPVDGGECTACHAPHQSENPKLLLRTGPALCLFCHDSRLIFKNEKHKESETTDCIECHNPHGGNKAFFLK